MSIAASPELGPEFVERVLAKLGLTDRLTIDLAGLNRLYAAWCVGVPFDNVHKRIWFAGARTTALPGGDPSEFFDNWLDHGTGGTCWPTSGAICTLAHSLGFDARRIAGAMIESGEVGQPAGHGSVLVKCDGIDYLIDASILAFEALPLVPGVPATAGEGIHSIAAVPTDRGFEVVWYTGHIRDEPIRFRPEPVYDPVDHAFFLEGYEQSAKSGPFNDALHICRRFPDSIATLRRKRKTLVAADGTVTVTEVPLSDRPRVLAEDFNLDERIVSALPPDDV